ncbi:FAD-linked oxidoreductase [Intrasporangium oryzae NRRL B-24470]|uniref:FAD-linked oxidoreductase n=1 Tax=Intrasporangium oryzae NRRL B-24470 TaxID=1386089 RepID=W9G226_9MICO|nr:FAD-linked oxidoreductase [Intrasporangium oryzae NRRL B-24470]
MVRAVEWSNWAHTESTRMARIATPRSEAEVAEEVQRAAARGLRVKAVGAGHSFTGVAVTDGVQLRLGALSGVTSIDATRGEATVHAGTPLHVLNDELAQFGFAMPNLGDIDRQSLAGATGTGTHGTGLRLTGLSAGIRALRIVLADGSVVDCSPTQDPELFQAARLGLGALGIVTELTIAVVPAFLLHAVERPEPLFGLLDRLDEEIEGNDHFEFYWFPHTDRTMTKRNNRVPAGTPKQPLPAWRERLDDDLLSNKLFEGLNRLATRVPRTTRPINAVAARALSERQFTDVSHRVFVTARDVRFMESEWAFPRAALADVLLELREWVNTHDELITFPVECRVAAPDDVWLSTAYDRESAYIAIHRYHRQARGAYFAAFEAIATNHGGRPHWGKLHTRDADYLKQVYPRFADFVTVRDRVDPERRFGNAYLERVLGS